MQIKNHKLVDDSDAAVPFVESPNKGGALTPRYLVMHFTAGASAEGSIKWLCNPDAQASAHLVIARSGVITQLVPFNKVAWHAGQSRWQGLSGLNQHSIGIEMDNAGGPLKRVTGGWQAWFGTVYPSSEVLEAEHKFGGGMAGWHLYTPQQLEAARLVAALLVKEYELLDVIGHDDIAPTRKTDPGPAFPMESIRSAAMGRKEDDDRNGTTTTDLNIRSGPTASYPTLDKSPLKKGTKLNIIGREGKWLYVEVLKPGGAPDLTGWVHGDYVTEA